MTIAKLQQFLAVCQFQSVSRAAEFLHISQPSVSGTIRDLESEFQINLFRHEGRRLVLTAEGSFLRERAQKLIRQFDELSWQMEDLGNQKNRFRIGIPPMAGTVFFPQLHKAFQAAYPEITLSITECGSLHAEKLLEQGELDLAWPRSRRLLLRNFPVRSLRGHSWCSASVLPIAWPGRKQSM